ncbi:MAG: hypothetical protein IJG97_01050 [Bacilli bacterium]|nr:hypothetical protein [Bacilli bacterium]
MKIDKIGPNDYQLYIFKDNKELSEQEVRELLKKLQDKLKLKGFYRVIVCNKKIGTFIELLKIEDSYYKRVLDLKIIIENEEEVYFKTEDYFLIKELNSIKYNDKYYYGLVDDSFDKILEKVEFGEFIFGERLSVVGGLNEL